MEKTLRFFNLFTKGISLAVLLISLGMLLPNNAMAQPGNDLCAGAIAITCGSTTGGTTVGATIDGAPSCDFVSNTAPGVWYSFTGTGNAITVSVCDAASFDTKLSVFEDGCGTLTCVGGNDDDFGNCSNNTSQLTFASDDGVAYLVLVHGFGSAEGTFDLTLTCADPPGPPPANDLCADAIAITCGSTTGGTTVDATFDDVGFCGTGNTAPGVWYSFTGTGNTITVSVCDAASYDTKLSVFEDGCGTLTCVDGNDDVFGVCSGNTSQLAFSSDDGVAYLVLVHGFSDNVGTFDLTLTCAGPATPPTTIGTLTENECNIATTLGASQVVWVEYVHDGILDPLVFTTDDGTSLTPDNDTEIGIYASNGALIANNDDIGFPNLLSELNLVGTTLPAGTYYIAVGSWNTTFSATDFNVMAEIDEPNTGDLVISACPTFNPPPPVIPLCDDGSDAMAVELQLTGINSVDGLGDPDNETGMFSFGSQMVITAAAWDGATATNPGLSWCSEAVFSLMGSATLNLTMGVGDNAPGGCGPYSSDGVLFLADIGLEILTDVDGNINWEAFESFDDGDGIDATWTGGTITLYGCPFVPPPPPTPVATLTEADCDVTTALGAGEVVWATFVHDGSVNTLIFDTEGSTASDTEIGVYTADGTFVASNDDGGTGLLSSLSLTDLPPGTYYIAVGGFNTTFGLINFDVTSTSEVTGDVVISICNSCFAPPANDDVCNAITIEVGVPAPADGACATAQPGEANPGTGTGEGATCNAQDGWCDFGGAEPSVDNTLWYTFVPPPCHIVNIQTDGTGDSQLALWEATDCSDFSTFTEVAANDDSGPGLHALLSDVCLDPDKTYYIQVDGFNGSAYNVEVLVTPVESAAAPVINSVLPTCYKYCAEMINPQPSDVTYTTDCNVGATVDISEPVLINGTANCGVSPFGQATYQVTYIVRDDCDGTSLPETRDFIIQNDGPVITCAPFNLILECGDPNNQDYVNTHLELVSATTSCDLGVTITRSPQNVSLNNCNQSRIVTFTATDVCGRTATCTTQITMQDNTPPAITSTYIDGVCNEAVCGSNLNFWFANWKAKVREGLSATDACDPNARFTTSPNLFFPNQACPDETSETVITWIATDRCGNTSGITYTFYVVPAAGPQPPQIMGFVATEQAEMVQDVAVSLQGDVGFTDMYETAADGMYGFSNLEWEQNYRVTPYLNEDPLNGVSSFDLVLIAKHILQMDLLDSPYKIIAADVNNSGTVTTADLVELRKLILHVNESFLENTSWRFIEAAFAFPESTNPFATLFPEEVNINELIQEEQHDFVAVKIGDVNGSATANNFVSAGDRNLVDDLVFNVADQQLNAGQTYEVTFRADNFDVIHGYQFSLNFDPTLVDFADIRTGELTNMNESNFGLALLKEGVITTSWTNQVAQSATKDIPLFHLSFTAKANALLSEVINISSRYTMAEAYNADLELMDVQLRFEGDKVQTNEFQLYQNTPNPFKATTIIGFTLPEAASAILSIYDVSGRMLKQVKGDYTKGYNEVSLDKSDLQGSGLLYYQLVTADFEATKMMMVAD